MLNKRDYKKYVDDKDPENFHGHGVELRWIKNTQPHYKSKKVFWIQIDRK